LEIKNGLNLSLKEKEELIDIFFENSVKKTFLDQSDKSNFLLKYFGYYLDNYPKYFFLITSKSVLGYVCAIPKIFEDEKIKQLTKHIELFDDLFNTYPAHAHINITSKSQGQGIGTKLFQSLENQLVLDGIKGIHIVTVPNSDNVKFYRNNGFDAEHLRGSGISELLFMAKTL